MLCPFSGWAEGGYATVKSETAGVRNGYEVIKQNFRLYYRQSDIAIDSSYLNNAELMKSIVHYLACSPRIDSISICAYASPEGRYKDNKRLGELRAQAVEKFLLEHLSPKASKPEIILSYVPEHWEGLYDEVKSSYHRHDRDAVLEILEDESTGTETKKRLLQRLDGGRSWQYLIKNPMPELRVATWICVWEKPTPVNPASPPQKQFLVCDAGDIVRREIQPVPVVIEEPAPEKEPYIPALRTNLLYDVVTVLNASVEFPIGERFSIIFEDVFPWWNWGPNGKKYCIQILELGLEPRWWFKSNGHLLGHFAGLYGKSGKYDMQFDKAICYQGEYWSAGLSYGYAMKIGKTLHLEFSLSLGYVGMDYRHYQPDLKYEHLFRDKYKVGKLSYFGPTKLAVTLVWPIEFGKKDNKTETN